MAPSINDYKKSFSWVDVLPLLGCTVINKILPATTNCPICGNISLIVMMDAYFKGEWTYCSNCKYGCDVIELAAKTWNISESSTILRLNNDGLYVDPELLKKDNIRHYTENYVDYQRRIHKLWAGANKYYPFEDSKTLRDLQYKFGIMSTVIDKDRWLARTGQFVGGSHRQEVEQTFSPSNWEASNNQQKGNMGYNRAFIGWGWGDLLAIPYYDMPRRGWLFLFLLPEDCCRRGLCYN